MGFSATGTGDRLEVWVPSWRPDIRGEADLVEEIARVASLSRLPARPLTRRQEGVAPAVLTPAQTRASIARRRLAALGLNECITYSFVSGPEAAMFGGGSEAMRLQNPISSEMSDMRPSLLPGLLAAAARNQARGFADLGLFELGPVFHGAEPGDQVAHATALLVGATTARHWAGTHRPVDALDARAVAEAVLEAAGQPADRLSIARAAPAWFHPGRSGVLRLGPKLDLAAFGELHPAILEAMGVRGPAMAATVFLDAVPLARRKGTARPALLTSDFQAVERDFAFVVDARVEADAVLRAVRSADKALIAQASVFDVFAGRRAEEQLGEGRKSVAVGIRLEPKAGTLTEEQIEAVCNRVIASVASATGGQLRG